MDTDTLHLPALPTEVEQRIRDYRPRALAASEWARHRETVTMLVAAAPPADPDDARDLLTTAVALVSWAHGRTGDPSLPALLEGPWVDRFAAEWRHQARPLNTLRNHLARLRRLQRTARGGDGSRRIRRVDRAPAQTQRPYGTVERAALEAAATDAPPAVGDAIRLSLALADRGIVVPDAFEHGLSPEAWATAQGWVRDHRLPPLDRLELRRMWAREVANTNPLLETLAAGVTRNELDGLRPHLDGGESDHVVGLLRTF